MCFSIRYDAGAADVARFAAFVHGCRTLDQGAVAIAVLVEPSAAAGLAAIACHDLPGATLATVLTGADPGSS